MNTRRLAPHVNGWLLLLPAAVLLVAFTHYPTVATLWGSFFSTPPRWVFGASLLSQRDRSK